MFSIYRYTLINVPTNAAVFGDIPARISNVFDTLTSRLEIRITGENLVERTIDVQTYK